MNINVKSINKEKLVENEGGIPTKCPICLLFIRLDYKIWYQIKLRLCHFTKIIKYANYLIQVFMNINVNIRNKTKLVEILRGYTYKITCSS